MKLYLNLKALALVVSTLAHIILPFRTRVHRKQLSSRDKALQTDRRDKRYTLAVID